jgi:hypothetical protein
MGEINFMKKQFIAISMIILAIAIGLICGIHSYPFLAGFLIGKIAGIFHMNTLDSAPWLHAFATIITLFFSFYRIRWQFSHIKKIDTNQLNIKEIFNFFISSVLAGMSVSGVFYSIGFILISTSFN